MKLLLFLFALTLQAAPVVVLISADAE